MTTPILRPPITAHVLDTTLGRPAAGIPVALMSMPSISPPPPSPQAGYHTPFSSSEPKILATSKTNFDGRVAHWDLATNEHGQKAEISTEKGRVYMLRFETHDYYTTHYGEAGGFFPWVDVVFVMGGGDAGDGRAEEERKHYHVPVLLSRFGYSTYRGS